MSEIDAAVAGGRTWEEFGRGAAGEQGDESISEESRRVLTFEVDATAYAVAVERVREIVRIRPITPVPRVSRDVRGIISLRGEIVEVVDLRRRLGLDSIDPIRSTRIIVVSAEDGRVAGLLVDAVHEVLSIEEDSIRAAAGGETESVESLCTHGDRFISLIDLDRILRIDADG
jgi:purine-binding chemotaxis protein CheW